MRPRILFLIENVSILHDRRVRQEAAALSSAGCQVSVICPRLPSEPPIPAVINGLRVYSYLQPWQGSGVLTYALEYGWSLLATSFLVLAACWRGGFDVLHAANPPDLFFLIAAPFRWLGKKFVFDQHDLSPDIFAAKFGARKPLLHWILLCLERSSYRVADLVIVTNQSFRRLAITRGRCPTEKVVVVRNGPDLSRFACGPADPDLKRGAAFLAVYAGIMGTKTGVDRVIRAAHHIVHTRGRSDVHFALLGEGECRPALQRLARSLQVEPYVSFPGFVGDQQLLAWLSTADVCLAPDPPIPVNQLCTSTKLMEYMSCGKPAVCFDLVEARYSAGSAALYVQRDDPALLGDAILELLDDPLRRRRMGQAGLQRVRRQLNWHPSRLELLQAYRQLTGAALEQISSAEDGRAA
ncbi:MAG TPA: glycosyltransferase family 4 protein [Terriglobales bacterium]|nr:glycosyltransferase family 4 protein [Terriglobales bacterium]